MSAAFTSGPWVWVEGSDAINRRWNNLDWTVASVGNHRLGWHEDQNSQGREAGANARLIAAAPELLAALQMLYGDTADYIKTNKLTGMDNHAMKAALSAITKAIGPSA